MYQKDIIKKISEKTGFTQKDCTTLYEKFKDILAEQLTESLTSSTPEKFYLSNFGVFEVKTAKFGKASNKENKTIKWKPFKRNVK
jgi:nucleoid DNA-binding protein